jgi:hypothetical protein
MYQKMQFHRMATSSITLYQEWSESYEIDMGKILFDLLLEDNMKKGIYTPLQGLFQNSLQSDSIKRS